MNNEEEIKASAESLSKIYKRLEDKEFFLSLPGDALAYTANKIAALKARLVDVKHEAERDYRNAETEYKRTKAVAYKRLIAGSEDVKKVSATAAAALVYDETDVYEARMRMGEAQALWNFAKSLVADGHDMVESIRSRLIDMQGDRKDGRV